MGNIRKELIEEIADIDLKDESFEEESDDTSEEVAEETKDTGDDAGNDDETAAESDKSDKEGSGDVEKKKEDKEISKEEGTEEAETEEDSKKDDKTESDGEISSKEVSQVEKLLAEIERLSGLVPKPVTEVSEEDKKDEKAEEVVHDFLKDLDMDDVSSDPAVLNKILLAVAAKVQQQTTEQVLRSIPQVVVSQVQQQTYFKRMSDKFYDDNKDLVNVKQVVRACAQQIQQSNPEWEIDKVFSEAAVKTRQTLGLTAPVIGETKEVETIGDLDDAAFAKSKGGSKSNLKLKRSSLQTEIDEL